MRLTFVLGHFRLDVSRCEDDGEPERDIESTSVTEVAPVMGFAVAPETDDAKS